MPTHADIGHLIRAAAQLLNYHGLYRGHGHAHRDHGITPVAAIYRAATGQLPTVFYDPTPAGIRAAHQLATDHPHVDAAVRYLSDHLDDYEHGHDHTTGEPWASWHAASAVDFAQPIDRILDWITNPDLGPVHVLGRMTRIADRLTATPDALPPAWTHHTASQVLYCSALDVLAPDLDRAAEHLDRVLDTHSLDDIDQAHAALGPTSGDFGAAERWRCSRRLAAQLMWHRHHPLIAHLIHRAEHLPLLAVRDYREGVIDGITDATGPRAAHVPARHTAALRRGHTHWADGYRAGARLGRGLTPATTTPLETTR